MSRRTLSRVAFLGLLVAVVPVVGCGGDGPEWPNQSGPKVVASFPPLYCFTVNVAGPDAAVKIAMTNQGPHHFNPTHSDARLVRKADLFIVNGLGLDEQQALKMKGGSGNRDLKIINLGERFSDRELEEGGECNHDHAGHDHAHHHDFDPHVWLGIDHAIKQVEGIRDALKEVDPGHFAGYDHRAEEYITTLRRIKEDGKEMLKDKKNRRFLSYHGSLAYFEKSFGVEVAGVIQKTPGKEPREEELKALVEMCKEKKVRVIAVEPQYTGQGAAKLILERLKREGVEDPVLVEIDPLETANEADLSPRWYEERMRANLAALAGALE